MNGPAHSHADMRNRNPALQGVVAGAVEEIGNADGSRRPGKFNSHKKRPVIHNGVGKQPFIVPLIAQVPGRSVVEHARGADAGEE